MLETELISKYKVYRALSGRFVFVSGTNEDMAELRTAATAAIGLAGHTANDPHHTAHAHQEVCAMLTEELQRRADYYIGVFGFRYGSRIANNDETAISYTEFEFNLARQRWLGALRRDAAVPPPVFVFLPARGSAIEAEIRSRSIAHLTRIFNGDDARVQRDLARQERFLSGVWETPVEAAGEVDAGVLMATGNRNCRLYSSVNELKEQVYSALLTATTAAVRFLLDDDDTGTGSALPMAPPLAAPPGVEAAEAAIAAFERKSRDAHAPGLCLVLQARNPGDLRSAATELARRNPWDDDEPDRLFDIKENRGVSMADLWQQVWDAANVPRWEDWENADDLATALVEDLDRPVTLFLHNVHYLRGGLAAFHEKLWAPLHAALIRRIAESPDVSRARNLLLVLTWQGAQPGADDRKVTAEAAAAADYSRLLLVNAAATPPSN